jgi:D-glycero-D-manno-heptose 1,7-bisphosphate phosphatase
MSIETKRKPAAFLDRDGTLVEEVNFLSRITDLRIFAFTAEAIRLLKEKGFWIFVVTNQSGIGRSIFDGAAMQSIHDEMQRQLGNAIDAFFHCPHLPGEGCRCRKPNLGMLEEAASRFDIDMSGSWFIGDKKLDAETGYNAGIRTAMVRTGYGRSHEPLLDRKPDVIADDLLQAVEEILQFEQAVVSGPV